MIACNFVHLHSQWFYGFYLCVCLCFLDGIIWQIYELTLLTAFNRSWFLLSNCCIMDMDPRPPPIPPNPNFRSFCTNDGWCKWLPTNPPTLWFPRCPLCGPWPWEFCDDNMAAWSCCCCCVLWCCCCCCWDDFIESCFIFSCSSRSRLACELVVLFCFSWCVAFWVCRVGWGKETKKSKNLLNFHKNWPKNKTREREPLKTEKPTEP